MRKILVLQSRTDPEHIVYERENFENTVGKLADVTCLSTLDESLAWTTPEQMLRDYHGVIFGGSADFDFNGGRSPNDPARLISMIILSRIRHFITTAIAIDFPVLGVCFGHQLIAQMHGGDIQNDTTQGKFGPHRVALTDAGVEDRLFKHMPQSFMAQYAHKDSVTKLPEGATLMATGPSCRFAALRYGRWMYTVQYHPESRLPIPEGEANAKQILDLWIEHIVNTDRRVSSVAL